MEIGEQHLPARQFFAFCRKWLFYLHDQLGTGEYGVAVGYDLGPSSFIVDISESCACPCLPLDHNLVPVLGELTHSGGHNTDAIFVVFDLLWYPDQHDDPLSLFYEAGGGMVPRPRSQSSHEE